jgi:hypothetical protein
MMVKRTKTLDRRATFPPWESLSDFQQWALEYFTPLLAGMAPGEFWISDSGEAELARRIEESPGERPLPWWILSHGRLDEPFKRLRRIEPAEPGDETEVRESEAAYLHRHGELTETEAALFEAGKLPTEELAYPAVCDPTLSMRGVVKND